MSKAKSPFLGKRVQAAEPSGALLYQRYNSVDELTKAESEPAAKKQKQESAAPVVQSGPYPDLSIPLANPKKEKRRLRRLAELEAAAAAAAAAGTDAGAPSAGEGEKVKDKKTKQEEPTAAAAAEEPQADMAEDSGKKKKEEKKKKQKQQDAAEADGNGEAPTDVEAAIGDTSQPEEDKPSGKSNIEEAQHIRKVLGYVADEDAATASGKDKGEGKGKANKGKKDSRDGAAGATVAGAAAAAALAKGAAGGGAKSFSFGFSVEEQVEAETQAKIARLMAVDCAKDGFVPRRVWVCGMPHEYSEEDIKAYWAYCGEVEELECLCFKDSGNFNGTCFITFKTQAGYESALACAGEDLEGRKLRVEKCRAAQDVRRREREAQQQHGPNNNNHSHSYGNGQQQGEQEGAGNGDGGGSMQGEAQAVPGYDVAYVGNIAFEVSAQEVLDFFTTNGAPPTKVRLHTDKATGRSKGFAHVHFADVEGLKAALALNGRNLGSRQLRVSPAQPKKN